MGENDEKEGVISEESNVIEGIADEEDEKEGKMADKSEDKEVEKVVEVKVKTPRIKNVDVEDKIEQVDVVSIPLQVSTMSNEGIYICIHIYTYIYICIYIYIYICI
jgi:hypothetical protein